MMDGIDKIELKSLNQMTDQDHYLGQDGGLYGNGKNSPPETHRISAQAAISRLKPRNNACEPDEKGTIGFVSISMSNATQEFSMFKQLADADPSKSKLVKIIDCSQGGQAMAEWVDPKGRPWMEAEKRLSAAGVNPNQIQVAWIKLANKGPNGDLKEHGEKLEKDTLAVIQYAKAKFRTCTLPTFLVEFIFVYNRDYCWRRCSSFASGRQKVGKVMLEFFKNDPLVKSWFKR